MKRILFFLFWLLLLVSVAHAQKPRLSFHADIGRWRPHVRHETAYALNSRLWQTHLSVGAGLEIRLNDKLYLSPELGLQYDGLVQDYGASRDQRHIVSKLGLFYGRISPGLTIKPLKHFYIRGAWGMLVSAFTTGEYSIWYVDHDLNAVVTLNYKDHFSRIRNPFLMGPELSLGVEGKHLGLRLAGFLTSGSVFRPDFWTLYNPRMAQVSLGVTYTFSKDNSNEH